MDQLPPLPHLRRWWLVIALVALLGLGGVLAVRLLDRSAPTSVTSPDEAPAVASDSAIVRQGDSVNERTPISDLEISDNEIMRQEDSNQNLSPVADHISPISLPEAVKLIVPFAEQAPKRIWDADHDDFCEEASALMVGRYFQGRSVGSADDVDVALFELKKWEEEHLSTWVSTTAAETARMIREVYGLTVEVVAIPASSTSEVTDSKTSEVFPAGIDLIKRALVEEKLVVVPAAGKKLGNPHFTPPGPVYHMLVLTGYTAEDPPSPEATDGQGSFITNDPGIMQGKDWVYKSNVLMEAIGDWNSGSPETGSKVVLIIGRSSDM